MTSAAEVTRIGLVGERSAAQQRAGGGLLASRRSPSLSTYCNCRSSSPRPIRRRFRMCRRARSRSAGRIRSPSSGAARGRRNCRNWRSTCRPLCPTNRWSWGSGARRRPTPLGFAWQAGSCSRSSASQKNKTPWRPPNSTSMTQMMAATPAAIVRPVPAICRRRRTHPTRRRQTAREVRSAKFLAMVTRCGPPSLRAVLAAHVKLA